MARRIKIMIICNGIEKQRDEFLEWCGVLEEHLSKKVKCFIEERRIETPYAIIDFMYSKPLYTSGYKFIFNASDDIYLEEKDEKILRLAIGEESV